MFISNKKVTHSAVVPHVRTRPAEGRIQLHFGRPASRLSLRGPHVVLLRRQKRPNSGTIARGMRILLLGGVLNSTEATELRYNRPRYADTSTWRLARFDRSNRTQVQSLAVCGYFYLAACSIRHPTRRLARYGIGLDEILEVILELNYKGEAQVCLPHRLRLTLL
jgi:hypothetical protein